MWTDLQGDRKPTENHRVGLIACNRSVWWRAVVCHADPLLLYYYSDDRSSFRRRFLTSSVSHSFHCHAYDMFEMLKSKTPVGRTIGGSTSKIKNKKRTKEKYISFETRDRPYCSDVIRDSENRDLRNFFSVYTEYVEYTRECVENVLVHRRNFTTNSIDPRTSMYNKRLGAQHLFCARMNVKHN